MIKHILAVGDSFTYGEELADRNDAWPQLVANALTANLHNQGEPGTGNTRMVRNIVDKVVSSNELDLVLVGWSSPGRIEFADDAGIFDTWPGYSGRMFTQFQPWRENLVDYVSRYHNTKYLYKQYLLNVLLIQNFLKSKSIRYIMMNTIANEYYRNNYCHEFTDLVSEIDTSSFIGWPDSGMVEWAYGEPNGARGHFLANGHQKVANKVLEQIKLLGW